MSLDGGWRPDPAGIALAVALTAVYLAGAVRRRRAGAPVPGRPAVAFALGVAVLLVATVSPVATAARRSVLGDVVQFCLLLLVAGPLLAGGRPVALWRPAGRRWVAPMALAVATPALAAVVGMVWFFSPWYAATWRSPALAGVGVAVLLGLGAAIALPVLGAVRAGSALGYAPLVFASFIELLADSVPGAVLTFQTHLLAAGPVLAATGAGRAAALAGQRAGGELLWVVGELIDLPFLAVLVWQWSRQDAVEAAAVDRVLDAQWLARRAPARSAAAPSDRVMGVAGAPAQAAAVGAGPDQVGPDAALLDRPWWEADATVFGSRRAAQYRRR